MYGAAVLCYNCKCKNPVGVQFCLDPKCRFPLYQEAYDNVLAATTRQGDAAVPKTTRVETNPR